MFERKKYFVKCFLFYTSFFFIILMIYVFDYKPIYQPKILDILQEKKKKKPILERKGNSADQGLFMVLKFEILLLQNVCACQKNLKKTISH